MIFNKGYTMALSNVGVYDYPSVGNIADKLKHTNKNLDNKKTNFNGLQKAPLSDLTENETKSVKNKTNNKNILENDTESDSVLKKLEDFVKNAKKANTEINNIKDLVNTSKSVYEKFSNIDTIKKLAASEIAKMVPPDVKAGIDKVVERLCSGADASFAGSVRDSINLALISTAIIAISCSIDDKAMVGLLRDTLKGGLRDLGVGKHTADLIVKNVVTKGTIDSDTLHSLAKSAIELDNILNGSDAKIALIQNAVDNTKSLNKSKITTLGSDAVNIGGSEIIDKLKDINIPGNNSYSYAESNKLKEDIINSAIVSAVINSHSESDSRIDYLNVNVNESDLLDIVNMETDTDDDIDETVLNYVI